MTISNLTDTVTKVEKLLQKSVDAISLVPKYRTLALGITKISVSGNFVISIVVVLCKVCN